MEEVKTKGVQEIREMVARKGRVAGVVRVVGRVADIGKLEAGNILVASETTPDYVVGDGPKKNTHVSDFLVKYHVGGCGEQAVYQKNSVISGFWSGLSWNIQIAVR